MVATLHTYYTVVEGHSLIHCYVTAAPGLRPTIRRAKLPSVDGSTIPHFTIFLPK